MAKGGWEDWVGRTRTSVDEIALWPARALAATLGEGDRAAPETGSQLPYPWVWTFFLEAADKGQIGPDGHPRRGGFLPPVPNPRRMWAGSRCTFHAPIPIGDGVRRTSTIETVAEKEGRTGPMVFVTVVHEIETGGALAMREEQDIVYMDIPEVFRPPEGKPVPACPHVEAVEIDPVLLFRFSALTFNGHRIHYDLPYARDVEKYPGLVVHGPLQAILLYDFAMRTWPGRAPSAFRFRGMRPLFHFDELTLNAREVDGGVTELFTANGDGAISMKATLEWAS